MVAVSLLAVYTEDTISNPAKVHHFSVKSKRKKINKKRPGLAHLKNKKLIFSTQCKAVSNLSDPNLGSPTSPCRSVTRWLNCLFNICQLIAKKIYLIAGPLQVVAS